MTDTAERCRMFPLAEIDQAFAKRGTLLPER
jgi:hypothetical protein